MSDHPTPVAEVVTFRLVPGTAPEAFVRAAGALQPVLEETQAVLSRSLSVDADGLWTDHITWTSLAVAKATANAVMVDPRAAPMMQMIDAQGMQLRHADIMLAHP
ncbi:hypothetical protein [Sulfitobacter sp. S190]|uniref:hypothetical protein n=1 Tax=Sulfitobacter sp. S190 TaxID=2867022 RepID=UPI0021A93636|nr:hypothetical protein [Sulfitobacter sp. S190]UWR23714.1 hypothetical protein K3756_07065 [Sulfitobacter sp. S190]